MPLNDEIRVRTQQRDLRLFELLRKLRFMDVDQVCRLGLFTSRSRAKARLLALSRSGYIEQFFVGTIAGGRKAVYCLRATRKQRDVRPINSAQTERFIDHQLALNEIYILLSSSAHPVLRGWQRCTAPLGDARGVIPDAIAQVERRKTTDLLFVEMDLGTESGSVWRRKTRGYIDLARSGHCTERFGHTAFRVLVIARSEDRIQAIRKVIARSTDKIFWLASMESINREGFWASIWLRPTGDSRLSLIS